jgi:hypothetical protein
LDSRNVQTTLRCHSAYVCTKVGGFNACVGVFKKNTDTKGARKQGSKGF